MRLIQTWPGAYLIEGRRIDDEDRRTGAARRSCRAYTKLEAAGAEGVAVKRQSS